MIVSENTCRERRARLRVSGTFRRTFTHVRLPWGEPPTATAPARLRRLEQGTSRTCCHAPPHPITRACHRRASRPSRAYAALGPRLCWHGTPPSGHESHCASCTRATTRARRDEDLWAREEDGHVRVVHQVGEIFGEHIAHLVGGEEDGERLHTGRGARSLVIAGKAAGGARAERRGLRLCLLALCPLALCLLALCLLALCWVRARSGARAVHAGAVLACVLWGP